MSPLRLRASFSLLLLLLLLLLGGCLLAAARRDEEAAGSAAESVRGPAGGSSGRFISLARHACSWQLLLPAPGRAVGSELSLRCQGPDGERQQCAYHGEPQRCAAYAARGSHYWKQVLGRLRKKRRPCQDPAPLKARLCAGKKGHGAELRLVSPASPPASPTAAGFSRDFKPRARSRERPREPAIRPASRVPPPPSARPKGKPLEKKTKGSKRKVASDPDDERLLGTGPDPDGLDENAKLTETYCAEKWHSLCNFLVSFWNG
ncbi:fibroblast growth factor-binding protein 3 [Molossus nigricans]